MNKGKLSIPNCPTCGSPAIRKVRGTWTGSFKGENYTVKGLEYYSCPNCKEKVYPPAAMQRIQRASPAYAKRPGQNVAHREAIRPSPTHQTDI
jgi:YgiT-type zinc finger domain-containing protein